MSINFNEYAPLSRVLVKSPKAAFGSQAVLNDAWQSHHYLGCPDFQQAINEHDAFVEILKAAGAEVSFAPANAQTSIDSLYMRDSSLLAPGGMILCNMGKSERRGEREAAKACYKTLGIPVLGEISDSGTIEGGDVVWLDKMTVLIADGYRTNPKGIQQLQALLPGTDIIPVPLPHWNGPADVLHLMSFLSPVDTDLAVVYPRMMPVPIMNWLKDRDIQFVEVPDDEYDSMGCNVLALGPRHCLMVAGNPITKARLEAAGCTVTTYEGKHISYFGSGGPTCLTRPLERYIP